MRVITIDRVSPGPRLRPGAAAGRVSPAISVTVAAVVIAAWASIPPQAGAWRTRTRDA